MQKAKIMNPLIHNPFFTTTEIPAECFCDRAKETEDIIRILTNGNNLVIKGQRRMGKSGLIHHVFNDPRIVKKYNTFYFDILETSSLDEFTYLLGRTIYKQVAPKGKKAVDSFFTIVKSFVPRIAADPVSGQSGLEFSYRQVQDPLVTLDQMFTYLEQSAKPNLVAIDEFQQIGEYAENKVEAFLRARIQRMNNAKFIFSGSERHMLDLMFFSEDRPFYDSARNMDITAIPEDTYCEFAIRMFRGYGKELEESAARYVYHLFDGLTYYMQATMNEAFAMTLAGESCAKEGARRAVTSLLASNEGRIKEALSRLTVVQKRVLYAIALAGQEEEATSSDFIRRNGLQSASSVQSACKGLVDKKFLIKTGTKYILPDKLMMLWIRENYGG